MRSMTESFSSKALKWLGLSRDWHYGNWEYLISLAVLFWSELCYLACIEIVIVAF